MTRFTTITDLAAHIADTTQIDVDAVRASLDSRRGLWGRYEDIDEAQLDVITIAVLADSCESGARQQGFGGDTYSLTAEDCDYIVSMMERRPTEAEWADAGIKSVGSRHVGQWPLAHIVGDIRKAEYHPRVDRDQRAYDGQRITVYIKGEAVPAILRGDLYGLHTSGTGDPVVELV
ncbi:MAG: hypothetical protein ABS36_11025 [Acidobacteria bacterium SCN 69-37]|nr:MAG: hypothetical protein ABS36_11025 [Acidobacteria bacterium SCN 69-37]